MRSVSKIWNALLSQPSFVKSHLHHSSIHNNDRILLVFYSKFSSQVGPEPYTAHPSPSPSLHLELTNFIKLPLAISNSRDSSGIIRVIGSVYGLICSHYGYNYNVIHIWNPSLSAVSTLAPHSIPSCSGIDISFRFGYDPNIDDYKIVKLTGLKSTSPLVVKEWLQVEVYSMRKGSWKFITQRIPSHVTWISHHDGICVGGHDGHLHWHGYIDEGKKLETIVAFDLSSETFREIPFPDSVLGDKRFNAYAVLGGKLCVMSWVTDYICEVWVMEEYGVAESWVKRHVFCQFIHDLLSFGFTSRSEFGIEYDCHLILYNPIAKKATFLENLFHGKYCTDKTIEYVDGLVWVAPDKH